MNIRQKNWSIVDTQTYDAVIIGAGINGASIFRRMSMDGYRVLLVDKGDFSCGSSQASAMMIWGGLLYLRNLDFASVSAFSRDRDSLIASFEDRTRRQPFRYIVNAEKGRSKHLIRFALYVYWLLGQCRRAKPKFQTQYNEQNIIKSSTENGSFVYEEGYLKQSDSRFVLDWILAHQTETSLALNYCTLEAGGYNRKDNRWTLELTDSRTCHQYRIKTRSIINCAGVWTDQVNAQFRITSPYRHVFSKGVFVGYERPHVHNMPLVFEMGEQGDTLTFIPWGPVSLWGPTETMVHSVDEGFRITHDDVQFLQTHAERHLHPSIARSPIISLRCGVRPLVVKKNFQASCYPLDLSRRHKVVENKDVPWLSVYGGKISGCLSLAKEVTERIASRMAADPSRCQQPESRRKEISLGEFPGMPEKVVSPDWCIEHEFCCTLEDYLRRRTTIAQWIPREGLGWNNENVEYLKAIASRPPAQSPLARRACVNEYLQKVQNGFDRLVPLVAKGESDADTAKGPSRDPWRRESSNTGSWPGKQVA